MRNGPGETGAPADHWLDTAARAAARRIVPWLPAVVRIPLLLAVVRIFLTDPGMNGFFASRFEEAVHGRSFQPYVYRALIPWTMHLVTQAAEGARFWVAVRFQESEVLRELITTARVSPRSALELGLYAVLVFGLLYAFTASLRRTCRRLYAAPPLFAEVVALAALFVLPALFSYNNYVYDPGTIVFSALALEALAARRWWWFVVVVAAGYFNKETIVLFVPLFAVHALGKVPWKHYAAMLGLLVVAFVASRVVLNSLYGDFLGTYTIPQLLSHNLKVLRSYPVATVMVWLGIALATFGHFSAKPALLKLGLACHLPLFGACLLWGYFDELRDYYEAYPMIVLMMAPTIATAVGCDVRLADPPPAPAASERSEPAERRGSGREASRGGKAPVNKA